MSSLVFIISLLELAVTPGFPSFQLRSLEKTLRLVLALPHRAAVLPNIAPPCGLPAWPWMTMEDLKFSPNRIIWGATKKSPNLSNPFGIRSWRVFHMFFMFFRHHEIEVLELAWMMCSDSCLIHLGAKVTCRDPGPHPGSIFPVSAEDFCENITGWDKNPATGLKGPTGMDIHRESNMAFLQSIYAGKCFSSMAPTQKDRGTKSSKAGND